MISQRDLRASDIDGGEIWSMCGLVGECRVTLLQTCRDLGPCHLHRTNNNNNNNDRLTAFDPGQPG